MRASYLAAIVGAALAWTAFGGETMILEAKWLRQPASSSSLPPDPKLWKPSGATDWRWCGAAGKTVNSLWYEQDLNVPATWNGKRLFLDFRRIEGDAIVFLNGVRVGELLRPGGEIEITKQAKPEQSNQLRVFVTRDYTDISRGYEQDRIRHVCRDHEFGAIPMDNWALGITAPVTLLARPRPAAMVDLFVQPSFRTKELKVDVDIDAAEAVSGLTVSVDVFDQDGVKALSFASGPLAVPAGRSTVSVASKWEAPHLWELDGGYLYTIKTRLARDGRALDESAPVKFGFREIWTEGRKLMMNGHESRWRMVLNLFSGANALGFMRLMGFNASYVQANPTMWWRDWSETPLFDEAFLDAADQLGYAIMLPSPGVSFIREALCNDAALRQDFERETALHLRHYRNHPSVVAWVVAMNSYNPRDAVSPQGMGRRYSAERVSSGQPKALLAACDVVKRRDKTRLVYSHADGNLGDVASSNMYLNFAQLQEREEWPMLWNQSGDMPYQMAEFGQPYTANFWKGKRFLPTEYLAMYFGPEAYAAESAQGLASLVDIGLANKSGHGCALDWNQFPIYWDFQTLFVRNTNRAFRSWGVNCGWAYWLFDGYGDPPGSDPKSPNPAYHRYSPLKEPVSAKPAWANRNFDIYSQANHALLAYLGGWPAATDKTHSFFPGERVEKSVQIVWDGPGQAVLRLVWNVEGAGAAGRVDALLQPGESKAFPIAFAAPDGGVRKDFALTLKGEVNGKPIEPDSLILSVIPRPAPLRLQARVALLDPAGKSGPWLKSLGVEFSRFKSLGNVDLLVIGREALKAGDAMPYTPEDVKRGLKVLVLEQRPEVWRGFGFRSNEAMPRRAFASDPASPVFAGLSQDDLRDWRGAPDLLPAGKNQPADTLHVPKWTNTHGLASTMPQTPRAVGFTPVASAEFDLDYSPLLEWRYGSGLVVFSSFDLTGRVGVDPAATLFATNLLKRLDAAKPEPARSVAYSGGKAGEALLKSLCVDFVPWDGKASLLVVGSDSTLGAAEIEAVAQAGGHVLLLPQAPARLAQFGLRTERLKLQRVPLPDADNPVFRSIGMNLLRWRAPVEVDAIDGSVLCERARGKGLLLFCQIDPAKLPTADKDKADAVETSVWRVQQLLARLLTNLGAEPSGASAGRLGFLDLGPRFEPLNHWNVLGPYHVEREDGEAVLAQKFPGEEMAVAGDSNPNLTFKTPDGRSLDWRPTVRADENGFVNLAKALRRESLSVAYVVASVESAAERDATLRLGFDWRARVWVNGEEVFKTLNGGNKPAAYSVKVHLRKGVNSVGMKVFSGSKGHGFFADLSKELPAGAAEMSPEMKGVSFYAGSPLADEFDPYEYHYW